MEKNVSQVTAQEETAMKARGYNEDLLPSSPKKRTMGARNFFTLWMGSIHNIPNYAAVGGFIFLGLSPLSYAGSCVKLIHCSNFHEFEWRGWL